MSYFSGHNHTHYSNVRLLDSTIKENQLIDQALKLGLFGVAVTDHDTLSSHIKISSYLKELREEAKTDEEKEKLNNFKLILGNEIYLVRNGLNRHNYIKGEDRYWHFILLAKDEIGHEQLRKISSLAWKRSFRQYIERVPTYYSDIEEVIKDNKGHLIASTACLGSLFAHLLIQGLKDIEKQEELLNFCDWCKEMFGEDFYIEIQPSNQMDQILYNKLALKFAQYHNIKIIITTDSHYLTEKDRKIHKAFLNANEGEREVDAFYSATYMMSWEEICEYMKYFTKDNLEEIRLNTIEIMNKCKEYSFKRNQVVPRSPIPKDYPRGKIPPGLRYPNICKFFTSQYEDDNYFISLLTNKLFELGKINGGVWYKNHLERLEIECEEIWLVSERIEERLSSYFLTMTKIIDIAWNESESIVGPGRGSSYVMLACYLLGITQGDPLDSPVELPHWRFLHREKKELPKQILGK